MLAVQSPRAGAPRRLFAVLASALALAIGFSGLSAVTTLESAAAAASNPLAPLQKFTVLARENASVPNNGEIEGSLAVGGDLSFKNYNLAANTDGSSLPSVDGRSNVQLFVGGSVTFPPGNGKFDVNAGIALITSTGGLNVSADQRLYKGMSQNSYVKSQGGTQTTVASYTASAGAFAAAFPASTFPTLEATSASLASLVAGPSVAMVTADSSTPERTITLTSGKINVWNVSASTLASLTAVNFANNVKPSATTPLIINVSNNAGGTLSPARLVLNDVALSKYVLWNFSGWTTLKVTNGNTTGELNGSVLAPSAAFSYESNSVLNGQVAVKSFAITTSAEIHHYGFSYDVPEKTTVAGSWSTTTACQSPSNQLVVNAVTGVKYTWTKGKTGEFTSFSQAGLTGTYAFKVEVTDPALYTLGSNPATFEVTFTAPSDCNPTPKCIPADQVTYTYDEETNSGTVTVPAPHGQYGDTLCKPFWVSAVSWTYLTSTLWPQKLVHDNPMPNNEGGFKVEKSGEYQYGAPVVCGQGDIYASFVDQRTTSPSMQGYGQLNGPSTPFQEFFLHGMGFSGPTPTWTQTGLDCNKVTPENPTPTAIPAGSCDVDGVLTVGSGGTTAVLTSDSKVATINGVVYTLTEGNGTTGAWKVVATPAAGKYFAGPSQVKTYQGDLGTKLVCDSVDKPEMEFAVCNAATGVVTDAYVIIPAGTNFTFAHNGVTKNPGDRIDLPAGVTTTITVTAKTGFKNVGAASFDYKPEAIDCDDPVEYVAPTFRNQGCIVATGVITGAELEFTKKDHVTYYVDGVQVIFAVGETKATIPVALGTRQVTVVAAAGFFLAGTANKTSITIDYEVKAPAKCDQPVEYVGPGVTDQICVKQTGEITDARLTFTRKAHLTYFVDGVEVVFPDDAATVDVVVQPGTRVVTAVTDTGYFIAGTANLTTKDYDVLVGKPDSCDKPVDYAKPTVQHESCDNVVGGPKDGVVTFTTIPAQLTYVFNGKPVSQGDQVTLPAGTYKLVVTAAEGWFITGADTEEEYPVVVDPAEDCDEAVDYAAPTVQHESCDKVLGGAKDGVVTFTTIPAQLTYVFNGQPVSQGAKFNLPAGSYTLVVTAAEGWFITGGSAEEEYPVVVDPAEDCDESVEYVTPTVQHESCDNVVGGAKDGAVTFTTIPAQLTYVFNGKPVSQGDQVSVPAGTYSLVVTAADGWFIAGADEQETYPVVVDPAKDCAEVTVIPLDPFGTPQECQLDPETLEGFAGGGAITILHAEHVTWQISDDRDGVKKPVVVADPSSVFEYPAGDYHVWATADPGYFLTTPTSFPVKVAEPVVPCNLDTHADLPASATWTQQTCTPAGVVNPTITVEAFPGVTYFINGKPVTRTTTTVALGKYTITAAADDPANTVSTSSWGPVTFVAAPAALCGDLTTLALTGETPGGWLLLALVLLQAGLVLVGVRFIRIRRARHLAL